MTYLSVVQVRGGDRIGMGDDAEPMSAEAGGKGMLDGLTGFDGVGFVALEAAVPKGIKFDVEFHGPFFLVEKVETFVLEAGHQIGVGRFVGLHG